MTKPVSEKPVRSKPLFTSYTIIWSMLGALGLSYLGVAIFEPAWLGEITPISDRGSNADTQEAVLNLSGDVAGLRASIAKLELDVASVRADVTAQADQTHALGTQLSALEDKVRLGQTTVATAAPSANADEASATSEGEAAAKSAAKPAKIINASPKPIVTGSIEARPNAAKGKAGQSDVISFGPAIVKPAAKPIGIEIASGPSVDGLRLSWSQISEQNEKLKSLSARYADTGDAANPNFSLIAGPVKSKAEAARICKDLQAHYVTCKVGEFKGEEL